MNISSCLLVGAVWVLFFFLIFIYVRALQLPASDLSGGNYLGKNGEIYLVEVSVSLAC